MSNVHAVDFRLRSERPPVNTTTKVVTTTKAAVSTVQHNAEGEARAMEGAIWGAAIAGILVCCYIVFGVFGVWENPSVEYEQPVPVQQVQPAR